LHIFILYIIFIFLSNSFVDTPVADLRSDELQWLSILFLNCAVSLRLRRASISCLKLTLDTSHFRIVVLSAKNASIRYLCDVRGIRADISSKDRPTAKWGCAPDWDTRLVYVVYCTIYVISEARLNSKVRHHRAAVTVVLTGPSSATAVAVSNSRVPLL
jgi:hypothetical protein